MAGSQKLGEFIQRNMTDVPVTNRYASDSGRDYFNDEGFSAIILNSYKTI
jgi:hypothetical protein